MSRLSKGKNAQTNHALYNLTRRGIELDLRSLCRGGSLSVMACSPVEQDALAYNKGLSAIAVRHDAHAARFKNHLPFGKCGWPVGNKVEHGGRR